MYQINFILNNKQMSITIREYICQKYKNTQNMNFSEIKINDSIKKSLVELNFISTTEIQTEAIPFLLNNKQDLIALAQTGTGKTAAFGLPVIHQIIVQKDYT